MKIKPIKPFSKTVPMIMRGTDLLAFFVSSAKCAAASEPAKEPVLDIVPTKHAVPRVGQPPKFEKEPKTSLAEAFGARTQRGTIMQKKPEKSESVLILKDYQEDANYQGVLEA